MLVSLKHFDYVYVKLDMKVDVTTILTEVCYRHFAINYLSNFNFFFSCKMSFLSQLNIASIFLIFLNIISDNQNKRVINLVILVISVNGLLNTVLVGSLKLTCLF